jgi:hypothetical protein
MTVARSLHQGPCHVIVALDEESQRRIGRDVIGWPDRLAFVEEHHKPYQDAMDWVYAHGIPMSFIYVMQDGRAGRLVIEPFRRPGFSGVVTQWTELGALPLPMPVAQESAPALRAQ